MDTPFEFDENLSANLIVPYCAENFCLRYDLEVSNDENEIKMAQEFLDAIGKYCENTSSRRLIKLLNEKAELSVSEVFSAVSFNGKAPHSEPQDDFGNFHNFVTRYMIESGWLYDFMMVIFELPNIPMLRLSIFRYILANWSWIAAVYGYDILISVAEEYGKLSLENSAIEEEPLRKEFIRKVLQQEVLELEREIEPRILKMTRSSKRNNFFARQAPKTKFDYKDPMVRGAVEVALAEGLVSASMIQVAIGRGSGFVEDLISWLCEIGVAGEVTGEDERKILIATMEEFDELAKTNL